jgi:dTDP-glucose pyrophosphorylase/CBS domain-containing protein
MSIDDFIIAEDVSIFDAASAIDKNAHQIVFVCKDRKLVAALSDGDIRRHILRNGDFSLPVREIANYAPQFLKNGSCEDAQRVMKEKGLKALPVVNGGGEIVAIEFEDKSRVKKNAQLGIPVAIMAGGKGARLQPYTDVLPKPLLPVGAKTITEHIMDRFLAAGCASFHFILNYKKALIKAYFSETEYADKIRYYEENDYYGTGGGLKLLAESMKGTFFMSNCDILLDADYEEILKQHRKQGNIITLICAMKRIEIPYGTVQVDADGQLSALVEKPDYSMLTNTGFYVIEPEFLEHIQEGVRVDITDIVQKLIAEKASVGVFPVSENAWMDMGQMEQLFDMKRALGE